MVEADDLTGSLDRAWESLLPLLPLRLPVTAPPCWACARLAAVLTLDAPPALTAAAEVLRAGLTVPPDHVWLPHLTLSRRLDAETAAWVLAAVGEHPRELTFTELRHWNPSTGTLRRLSRKGSAVRRRSRRSAPTCPRS